MGSRFAAFHAGMCDHVAKPRRSQARLRTWKAGSREFSAVIALLLAAAGVYGVVAYRTELRTHGTGIRMALGASHACVLRLVYVQGLRLTLIGIALGPALCFGLTRVIAGLLYGVSADDPLTIAGVVVVLGAMSLLACLVPAYRAIRLDPVAALREL
jgi:ABC-type antimicrobial peptide transport system permease subunit